MPDLDFNYADVPKEELLPPAEYTLEITKTELAPTKKPGGLLLKMRMQVSGGQFSGKSFFHQLNYRNANQTAQDIGQRELKSLGEALGIPNGIRRTEDLENKRFRAEVMIEDGGSWGDKNRVKKFIKAEAPAYAQPPAQSAPPAQAPAANGAQAPAPSADPDKPVWAGN